MAKANAVPRDAHDEVMHELPRRQTDVASGQTGQRCELPGLWTRLTSVPSPIDAPQMARTAQARVREVEAQANAQIQAIWKDRCAERGRREGP